MTSIADGSVEIQTTAEPNFSVPAWFGEVVVISSSLQKHGVLNKITEQGPFARKRFGRYELIDFLAAFFGYAISGERTLEELDPRLQPFAIPFMALFERDRLPSRAALSQFLAALTQEPVEALRTLFLDDLLARPLTPDKQTGGLGDRAGNTWRVFDIDGTREAARQSALPKGETTRRPRFADWTTCARLETLAANAGRRSGRGPRSLRRTATSGSAVTGTAGTGSIGRNCVRDSRPLVGIWLPTSSHKNGPCGIARWAVRQWGGPHRSRWVRLCDPWQRLPPARPSARSDPSALAP